MSQFWSAIWQYAFVVLASSVALGIGAAMMVGVLTALRVFVHAPVRDSQG